MDITATLYDLIDAFNDGDRERATELIDAMQTWVDGGGFLPTTDRSFELNAFVVSRGGERRLPCSNTLRKDG